MVEMVQMVGNVVEWQIRNFLRAMIIQLPVYPGKNQKPLQAGCQARLAGNFDYPEKLSGNMPAEAAGKMKNTVVAAILINWHGIIQIVVKRLILLGQRNQMDWEYTICLVMYGNGARMFMMKRHIAVILKGILSQHQGARTGSCVAVPGSAMRGSAGRLIVTGSILITVSPAAGFGCSCSQFSKVGRLCTCKKQAGTECVID